MSIPPHASLLTSTQVSNSEGLTHKQLFEMLNMRRIRHAGNAFDAFVPVTGRDIALKVAEDVISLPAQGIRLNASRLSVSHHSVCKSFFILCVTLELSYRLLNNKGHPGMTLSLQQDSQALATRPQDPPSRSILGTVGGVIASAAAAAAAAVSPSMEKPPEDGAAAQKAAEESSKAAAEAAAAANQAAGHVPQHLDVNVGLAAAADSTEAAQSGRSKKRAGDAEGAASGSEPRKSPKGPGARGGGRRR